MKVARYTEEFRQAARERARTIGLRPAMRELAIPRSTLRAWLVGDAVAETKRRIWTDEEKQKVVARAREIGARETCRLMKISGVTLRQWAAERNQTLQRWMGKFSPEFRSRVIARAAVIGVAAAARECDISYHTVYRWMRASGMPLHRESRARTPPEKAARVRPCTLAQQEEIMARAQRVGVTAAAREAGIATWTVKAWVKRAGLSCPRSRTLQASVPAAPATPPPTRTKPKPTPPKQHAAPRTAPARAPVAASATLVCPPHVREARSATEWRCRVCGDIKTISFLSPRW